MSALKEIVLAKVIGAGGKTDINVQPLSVTENGDYNAPSGTAYNPVSVNVPIPTPTLTSKTVTENGVYNASSDSAEGYSSVTVEVPVGETYYVSPVTGAYYPKVIDQTLTSYNNRSFGSRRWAHCPELEEATIRGLTTHTNLADTIFAGDPKLKRICLPDFLSTNTFVCISCTALEEIQLGSVGHAVTGIYGNAFSGCTQAGLNITVYVSDSATLPLSGSPFGATNATIIYRSSTTGEVRA